MYIENCEWKYNTCPQFTTVSYYEGRYLRNYKDYPVEYDSRIFFRKQGLRLDEATFQSCVSNLLLVIDDYEKVQILSQINNAIYEFKVLNFRQALIQSWFVIEYFINLKCDEYIMSEFARDTDKKITGNKYTSSEIKLLILKDNKIIDENMFIKMNIIRKKRNLAARDIVDIKDEPKSIKNNSYEKKIDSEICNTAFAVIRDLIKLEYKLDLTFSCSLSLYYL